MNEHYNNVKFNEKNDITQVKTEEEWEEYKIQNKIDNDMNKEQYIKYGSIYGKKYCVKTNYGGWDSNFTMEILEEIICEYYKKLKKGGTLIMFFDLWKITSLKNLLEKYNFKQIIRLKLFSFISKRQSIFCRTIQTFNIDKKNKVFHENVHFYKHNKTYA